MSLYKMKDEPVSDRTPFLGVGNLTLELVNMGRGRKRDETKYSYLTYKVLESDTAAHATGSFVTKWIQDKSFSAQKDLKIAVAALMNKNVSAIVFEEIVPFFYDETRKDEKGKPGEANEDDGPVVGDGVQILKGRKVQVRGHFPTKTDKVTKEKTISTYPQHDWTPVDPPLDGDE